MGKLNISLRLADILNLGVEIEGQFDNEKQTQISKGLIRQELTMLVKYDLKLLLTEIKGHRENYDALRKELFEKYGSPDNSGNLTIQPVLEDGTANPSFNSFLGELNTLLERHVDISHPRFNVKDFDFKTEEVFPVFMEVLQNCNVPQEVDVIA